MSSNFNVIPKNRELVAVAGRWGLYKSTMTLETSPDRGVNQINITHRDLLTAGSSRDYINIKIAQEKSGLSYKQLIKLCENGIVEAQKSHSKWMISLNSLIDYITD